MKIIKRDGTLQKFDIERINNAIDKGFIGFEYNIADIMIIKADVEQLVTDLLQEDNLDVEEIQDIIVSKMRQLGYRKVANAYNKYRKERAAERDLHNVLEILSNEETDEKNDNANINGYTPSGRHLHISESVIKSYMKNHFFSKDIVEYINEGIIYPHDLGWGNTTMTCVQIDIPKLFNGGFSTGHGYLREPSNIKTAFLQSAIAIQSNQN